MWKENASKLLNNQSFGAMWDNDDLNSCVSRNEMQ